MPDETNSQSTSAGTDKQIEVNVDPKNLTFKINGLSVDHPHNLFLKEQIPVGHISIQQDKKTGEFSIKLSE